LTNGISTHSTFEITTGFKSLGRVLEGYIRIVIGPYDAINIARHRNKESRVRKFFDSALDHLANLNISYLQELLIEDRRLHGELKETIEGKISGHTGSMDRARLPRPRRRE
jgi:hypothetical protein